MKRFAELKNRSAKRRILSFRSAKVRATFRRIDDQSDTESVAEIRLDLTLPLAIEFTNDTRVVS